MKRTELSIFAEEFRRALEPCLRELEAFGERLQEGASAVFSPAQSEALLASLRPAAEELRRLLERVAAERVQVFLFGPPNAGKSTLLNALSGVHAVDVSALPGYPCVLRVSHASEPAARLEHFDGSAVEASNMTALQIHLQRSQAELAQATRAARARGEAFDGARDLPSAARRIELALPADVLERAAAQLIECPPMHGPLFPGYGSMLMGESGGPAVAVFVLRVTQLFDPTALAGFDELLEAFERLFLVVNLDAASRDLASDGEVVIGLERSDPLRVVEVFEKLTASPALERGLAEGRVRIVPLDLLEAARVRIALVAEAARSDSRSRFDDFLDELGETFDQHEVFQTFAHSVLRRAHEFLEEARSALEQPALTDLPFRLEQVEGERAARARAGHALHRLRARERRGWESEEAFSALRERLSSRAVARAQEVAQELARPLWGALEDWFASAESVQGLIRGRLAPRIADALAEIDRFAERALREELASPQAFERLSPDIARDLAEARLALGELVRPPAEGAGPGADGYALLPLDVEAIPVKLRLRDRLLFRSRARLRRDLIGPADAATHALPSDVKVRRLAKDARAKVWANADKRAGLTLNEGAHAGCARLWEGMLTAFVRQLAQRVEGELAQLEAPLRELERSVDELRAMRSRVLDFERSCSVAAFALEEISLRFGRAGAELVLPARPRRDALPAGGSRPALPAPEERERQESEPEGLPARE